MTCENDGLTNSTCAQNERQRRVELGVLCVLACLMFGCEIRPKPMLHLVEYQSGQTCVSHPDDCPWADLERQAQFTALTNCLLSGATTLHMDDVPLSEGTSQTVVAPHVPRFGYAHVTRFGDEARNCQAHEAMCQVSSRHDRTRTWAACGTESVQGPLRGGSSLAAADRVTESEVLTGRLVEQRNEFGVPHGLDGPDQFFTFTLAKPTWMEIAVAANVAFWSGKVGLVRAPWQPALYLLGTDGTTVKTGHAHRAGVTALFPGELAPGTYVIVVDSSMREWSRGDGVYRLYIGFNEHLMGPPIQ
ncbi:MAG TPA: hypothetical protein PKD12_14420 [Nitrospira sp.]|nr:hypothetical protein [Nitrospira sp.]